MEVGGQKEEESREVSYFQFVKNPNEIIDEHNTPVCN